MSEQRSDVYCTECGRTFLATLDLGLNGNHEITCPYCSHVHYRVVRDGVVTEDRWRSSAGPTYYASTSMSLTVTFNSTLTSTASWGSWVNRTDIA